MSDRIYESEDVILPKPNSIMQGEVISIKDYGAFIKLPGFRKNGLVHRFQISNNSIGEVAEVLSVKDKIWVKVIAVGTIEDPKISLSMKVVDQGSGNDLDPNGVELAQDEKRKKSFNPRASKKITLDAVYNTVCKKCGTKGHLGQDCFQRPGSKTYDLLSDDDEAVVPPIQPVKVVEREIEKVDKIIEQVGHKSKKSKKSKKDKSKEKHKKRKRRSSEDDHRKSKKHKK